MKTYESKESALQALRDNENLEEYADGHFITKGPYYLNHGEYDRPDYCIKQTDSGDYSVWCNRYYYAGTLYAGESDFIDIDDI